MLDDLDRQEGNPFVFVGGSKAGHLNPGSPLQRLIQRRSKVRAFGFHTLRHTLETRLGELGVSSEIRDQLFDHAPQRGAGKGYDHGSYIFEARHALEVWWRYLQAILDAEIRDKIDAVLWPIDHDDDAARARRGLQMAIQADAETWQVYLSNLMGLETEAA